MNMKKFILIVCCLCTFAASAQQEMKKQERKKVVISPDPTNTEAPKNIVQLFMNHLSVGLTQSGRYEVIENRREAAAVSREEQAAYDAGIVDDAGQVEFGHNEAAEYTCYVSIVEVLGIYNFTCKFQHLKSASVPHSFETSASSESGQEIVEAAKSMARKIANGGDFTSGPKLKWSKAFSCYWDELEGRYVDCKISISDEGILSYEDAASACANKGTGWRLPDKDELKMIYSNRFKIEREEGFVRFKPRDYWSSSKRNAYENYAVNFASGEEVFYSKNIKNPCRCISIE
jgi:hypothetical protein